MIPSFPSEEMSAKHETGNSPVDGIHFHPLSLHMGQASHQLGKNRAYQIRIHNKPEKKHFLSKVFKFSLMQKKNPRYFIFNSQGYTNATAAPLTSVIVEGCQKFSAYLDTVMCQENLTIFFKAAWKCFNLLYLKLSVSQPETFACLSSKGCKTIPDRNLTPLDFLSFVQSK